MFRFLAHLALRLLRCAGEAFFFYEVNRFLGRAVRGSTRHRIRALPAAEALLLRTVRAPLHATYIVLPTGMRLYTIIAGPPAKAANEGRPICAWDAEVKFESSYCSASSSVASFTSCSISSTSSTSSSSSSSSRIQLIDPGSNPLVLLHGHSMGGATFFRNIDDFLNMGFSSVYALDLPGWGRSTRPRFATRNVDHAVDFFLTPVIQWLRALRLTSFTLIGHSLGGYLAHEYTLRAPRGTVKRLVMIAPAAVSRHTPFGRALWFALTPQRFLTHGGLLAHLLFSSKYPTTPAYNLMGFRDFTMFSNSISHCSGDAAAAAVLRFCRRGIWQWEVECIRPLAERVEALPCPVHLIAGKEDLLVPVESIRELYEAMAEAGNRVAISVIRDADHSPHIVAPYAFVKALARVDASMRVVDKRLSRWK